MYVITSQCSMQTETFNNGTSRESFRSRWLRFSFVPSRRTITSIQRSDALWAFRGVYEWHWGPTAVSSTNRMRCNKEDKRMPQEEVNGASNICSPSLWQTDGADTWWVDSTVTHLACLSGVSNSEGQRWEQNKNKKEGTVLSQAGGGKTCDRAEC